EQPSPQPSPRGRGSRRLLRVRVESRCRCQHAAEVIVRAGKVGKVAVQEGTARIHAFTDARKEGMDGAKEYFGGAPGATPPDSSLSTNRSDRWHRRFAHQQAIIDSRFSAPSFPSTGEFHGTTGEVCDSSGG